MASQEERTMIVPVSDPPDPARRPSSVYDDLCNKCAEYVRGRVLIVVFAVLLVVDPSFWVWFHMPTLFQGKFEWIYPSLAAATRPKAYDSCYRDT
jgi:hypothetical protein